MGNKVFNLVCGKHHMIGAHGYDHGFPDTKHRGTHAADKIETGMYVHGPIEEARFSRAAAVGLDIKVPLDGMGGDGTREIADADATARANKQKEEKGE